MSWPIYDRQGEHWALIRREDQQNTRLAIFVHGFQGSYLSTWGRLSDYLRGHAANEPVLKNWDYLFLGYETYSIRNYLNIAALITDKWEKASKGHPPFDPNRYENLALFGHSLGTLGIRQWLCLNALKAQGILTALHAVVLLGSPLNGSPWARLAILAKLKDLKKGKVAALAPGTFSIAESLRPGGAPLTMLHAWNEALRTHKSLIKVTSVVGTDDFVVGDGGIVSWTGDVTQKVALDHRQICTLVLTPGKPAEGQLLDQLRAHLK
jgi:pimeloyl-ACP methyl ester carboxylesterase